MITAVCLNPCIDKTVEIDAFTYGGMNRIRAARQDGSGKGVNVALVAREMELEAACTGFLYRDNGSLIEQRLEAKGAVADFLWYEGQVRTNLKVFDRSTAKITEINEAGTPVTPRQLREMEEGVAAWAERSQAMVFTGSLPPGCPPDFYRTLLARAHGKCLCVLDAEGEKLSLGMEAKPYLIKPNLYELELRVGNSLKTLEEIKAAALECAKQGIALVAVSMGGEGALLTDGKRMLYAPPIRVCVHSTVGAGDSMVAGFLDGILHGEDLTGVFRRGVAAGTAAVMTEGTQLVRREDYEAMQSAVDIQEI